MPKQTVSLRFLCKKGVLKKNFIIFPLKHLYRSLSLNKIPQACNLLKKILLHRSFPMNTYFVEHVQLAFSDNEYTNK